MSFLDFTAPGVWILVTTASGRFFRTASSSLRMPLTAEETNQTAAMGATAFQKGLGAVHGLSHALGSLKEPALQLMQVIENVDDDFIDPLCYRADSQLGVPGLINAYKTATAMVLQLCPMVRMAVEVNYELNFNYTHLNDIMRLVKQRNLTILSQDLQLFCKMVIGVAVNQADLVVAELENLHDVEVRAIT